MSRLLVTAFAAVLLLSTCGGSTLAGAQCARRTSGIPVPPIVVALTNRSITVPLELPLIISCPAGNPIATTAITEVLDAAQRPVDHEYTAPTSSDLHGYATKVTFTPATPGVYFLTARFEPGLGVIQREVQVVLDRSADQPVEVFRGIDAGCEDIGALGAHTLCSNSGGVHVIRAGQVEQVIAAQGASLAPHALWTWTGSEVSRWAEEDGGLSRVSASVTLPAAGRTHAATDERLVAIASGTSTMNELVFAQGQLRLSRTLPLPDGVTKGESGLLLLSGDGLAWGTPKRVEGENVVEPARLCIYHLTPKLEGACAPADADILSREGDALWFRSRTGTGGVRFGVIRVVGESSAPSLSFMPAQPELAESGKAQPLYSWDGRLVLSRAKDFVFEAWPVNTTATGGSSETHAWYTTFAGETVVFRR